MILVALPNGQVDRGERGQWLTLIFDLNLRPLTVGPAFLAAGAVYAGGVQAGRVLAGAVTAGQVLPEGGLYAGQVVQT